jgi:selenocysteine lyase/cysteine desulfurase
MNLFPDEAERRRLFPACENKVFLAHAAVTVVPRAVADAMHRCVEEAATSHQENEQTWQDVKQTRALAADLIGADPAEIALLGPTALGLSLVANGLDWQAGDEVVAYRADYPANVYPWMHLEARGVKVRWVQPERPGEISVQLVAAALTPRTRLVALASAHYLSGARLPVEEIGRLLKSRGILFCLDAIQTLGAYPVRAEWIDFLSADAHKWLLGPNAIGIVYVKREHFTRLRPTLLGAWNVYSPGFNAQDHIRFVPTAQRYEPGSLNLIGIYGLKAALHLLLAAGPERIERRLGELKAALIALCDALGFETLGPRSGPASHAITTCRHPVADHALLHRALMDEGFVCSLRQDREGRDWLRFSPHFYNTEEEFDRLRSALLRHLSTRS